MRLTVGAMILKTARCSAAVTVAFLMLTAFAARGQLFEADSKRSGDSKMDIVVREVERRERASVLDIKINAPGSSVGASFFILCSIRQLAALRGNHRYVVKLEDPSKGRMLVGFLRSRDETPEQLDPEFQALESRGNVIDLEEYAGLCASINGNR